MDFKTLKFKTDVAETIIDKKVYKTWRLFDDKQLSIDDFLQFINSDTSQIFGYAKIRKITIKHIADIDEGDMQGHKNYNSIDEILTELKQYYGPMVNRSSTIKVIEFEFLGNKAPSKDVKKSTAITEVKIFTDGGSRGNPGPSACSYVLMNMDDQIIISDGDYLGITTNNQAEYQAALRSLKRALTYDVKIAHIYMDSLLVVNQMNGIYKVRNRDLWPIHEAIKAQINLFDKVTFTHIPREMNKLADSTVNTILDNQTTAGLESELL